MNNSNFVVLGDLHLDSPRMLSLMPDFNETVIDQFRNVCDYALQNGIPTVIQAGDLVDKAHMSNHATSLLLELFHQYPNLNFYLLKGNHDHADIHRTSLNLLHTFSKYSETKNLYVADSKAAAFKKLGFKMHPYTPTDKYDFDQNLWNICHINSAGATLETGKIMEKGVNTDAPVISGHIHVAHRVRNTYYVGSATQIHMVEPVKKVFAVVSGTTVEYVPLPTPFVQRILVVSDSADIDKLKAMEAKYLKANQPLFVRVLLTDPTLRASVASVPSVIDIKPFNSDGDQRATLADTLRVPENSITSNDVKSVFKAWLKARQLPDTIMTSTEKLHNSIFDEIASR